MTRMFIKYSKVSRFIYIGTALILCLVMTTIYGKDTVKDGPAPPPNILFIVADDLRPNLGCYGDRYAHTPNIDRLAENGVVFTRAYCQQAVCNPSRASLLTGLRPDETGVTNLKTHFRTSFPDLVTLPQLFKNMGYLTLGTGKVFHQSKETMDTVSWSEPISGQQKEKYILPENKQGKGKQNVTEKAEVHDTAYVEGRITRDLLGFLAKAKENKQPFFIAAGFYKPHAPYCAPIKYWDIYKGMTFEIKDRSRPTGSPKLAFHNNQEIRGYRDVPGEGPIPSEKEQEIIHGYYACISYVDAQVGMILDELGRLGLDENTIVVFWGDHGYHLGEQGSWCKSTNFELDARAPLIIAAPSMKGNGQKSDAIVEFVDVYPTLADLAGIAAPGNLSGVSLTPLLNKPARKWKNLAFNQFARPYRAIFKEVETHRGYSVRTEHWRCTCWYDLSTGEIVEKELYRLEGMDIEKENLAGMSEYTSIERRLTELISDYKGGIYGK
jgi:iduronate 2-sulfatase